MSELWIVGDVQGYLEQLRGMLCAVNLIDRADHWTGRDATLAQVGDLVDKGPDGIGVIEFLMRLQKEASVKVVLGNHDILFMAAHRFGGSFLTDWQEAGGLDHDLSRLNEDHIDWLQSLPAMALERDVLMVHADALFYLDYGSSLEEVNSRFGSILRGDNLQEWHRLLEAFSEHRAFLPPDGCAQLDRVLATFGGSKLVHGHTPIPRVLNVPPRDVRQAYVYCDGRCVNVDPGMYLGGPGFCYRA